uniref:Polysaccharide deacetylase n=1 Tax=Strongyloides papillosus TaxID=174720 RepID=A0A0N5C3B1_STREA
MYRYILFLLHYFKVIFQTSSIKKNIINFSNYNDKYCVSFNFWKDSLDLKNDKSRVTLVLHATIDYIKYLEDQILIWGGPISVAIIIPRPREKECLKYKNKYCLINKRIDLSYYQILAYFDYIFDTKKISLHLFFEKSNFKNCPNILLKRISKPKANLVKKYRKLVSMVKNLPIFFNVYPINVARNIARLGKRTKLFLSSDIENYSSLNFESKVSKLAKKVLLNEKQKLVLVHRRFEIKDNVPIPRTKKELKKLYDQKKAFVFHSHFYIEAHYIPKLESWFKTKEKFNETEIGWITDYSHSAWEPQFVGDDRVPFHDERFPYRIRSNTHLAHIMCYQGFKFAIINDIFTVHKGIKIKLNQVESKIVHSVKKEFRKLIDDFNNNLAAKYPHMKKRCKKLNL